MPVRDVTVPANAQPRPGRRLLVGLAGLVVALAVGIVIGMRLHSAAAPHGPVVMERAAPKNGAAQEPGRHANSSETRTPAGAVAAAARSITAFAGDVLLEPVRLRTLVARIASSASRAGLIEAFEEASAQTRAKLGADTVPRPEVVLRAFPAGYRIEHYSPDGATVAVWYVGVVGSGATVEPQQSWRTETVGLVWEDRAWKVDSFASTAGPTPGLATSDAEPPGALFAAIPSFRAFAYDVR